MEIPAKLYLNGRARREILANLLKRTGCEFQVVRLSTVYCTISLMLLIGQGNGFYLSYIQVLLQVTIFALDSRGLAIHLRYFRPVDEIFADPSYAVNFLILCGSIFNHI